MAIYVPDHEPTLADKLAERVRQFVARAAEKLATEGDCLELKISLYEVQWEDDDTPYMDARLEEQVVTTVGGTVPKVPS